MPELAALVPLIAQAEGEGGSILGFLPILIIGGAFLLLMYLPRRRQQKQAEEMLASIEVGDEVRTIGGIYGKIRSEQDDTYTIDLGDGSTMRVAKRAIAERLEDDSE